MVNMADSIKLFQFFQKCHLCTGIYPHQPNQKQRSINWTITIFLIGFAQDLFTTATYFLFTAKSMFEYGFAFYLFITILNTTVVYLIFIWQSQNTFKFIKNCEEFIEKRAHSTFAYNEKIETIELFNKIFCFGISNTAGICFYIAGPYSYARYYIFNMGEDAFFLFLPAWFPFDWKTPFGYLVALLCQGAGTIVVGSMLTQFLNIVFGSCWIFILIVEDITQDVIAFNIAVKETPKSNEKRTELTKQFFDMVQVYLDAKQCAMAFNQMFKYALFSFLSYDMMSASSLLVTIQFELWADDSKLFEILFPILLLNWSIVFLFLLCEPGARVTNQFEEYNNELNRLNWYSLPIELQRWYLIFLLDTQNPMKVSSYANIKCERETFKKVINTAFSYFMTLRRFKL